MNVFAAFWKRRALKRYARELPRHLFRAYGASKFYTRQQIEVAVGKLKLDPALIAYGYAAFLPEEAFNGLLAQMPNRVPYGEARIEISRYTPTSSSLDHNFYESGVGSGDEFGGHPSN